jgi:hypothetical protein
MVTVQNVATCPVCEEEYLYEVDLRTGEIVKLTLCKCDRFVRDAEEFLKKRGLWIEFLKYHKMKERMLKW